MPILPFRFIVPATINASPMSKPNTTALNIEEIIFFSLPTGHGFDLPGFRAGRKPCWIFSVLAVGSSGFFKFNDRPSNISQ